MVGPRGRIPSTLLVALVLALPACGRQGTSARGAGAPVDGTPSTTAAVITTSTVSACRLPPSEAKAVEVSGRRYLLSVPEGVTAAPLILAFHGLGSSPEELADYTDWQDWMATTGHRAVIAYPEAQGQPRRWDFGRGSADVEFARAVVADIEAAGCTDPAEVFAVGHSSGAYFAQRLGCDASDLVASVAEYAGGKPDQLDSGPCEPSRPVAVALFHGTEDPVVRIVLGRLARDGWVDRDGCGSTTSSSDAYGVIESHACEAGTEVQWREYEGQGHLWPTGAANDDLRDRMWVFLRAHPHPDR